MSKRVFWTGCDHMAKNNFIELGPSGSNIIHCPALLSQRLSKEILQAALISDEKSPSENSGHFKTFSVGNIAHIKYWDVFDLLTAIHNRIAKFSHLAMGSNLTYIPNRYSFHTIKHQGVGQKHLIHSDNDPYTISIDDRKNIVMSSTISLSSDYEGGLFTFPEYDISVKLEIGDGLFFPANGHWHEIAEVTSGNRYTLLHFWE